jgi:hypothetical protein
VLARQGVPHGTPQVRVMMISPVGSLTIERTNERLQGIFGCDLCRGGSPLDGNSFRRLARLLCLLS